MIAITSIPLERPSEGWFVYSYHLLSDGSLAALWTDRDIHREYEAWRKRADRGLFRRRKPNLWTGRAKLAIFNELGQSDTIDIPLVPYPKIDRSSNEGWIVACPRARGDEKNALILASDGTQVGAFHLGDGIEHIRCGPDGTIWVGYFDEGVFGNSIGAGGIVQFSSDGRPIWVYNDRDRNGRSFVDDCYALSVAGDKIWSCFYGEFPIVCIERGKDKRWSNEVSGAKALAVDGNLAILAGGYAEEADRLSLLRLDQTEAKLLGSCKSEAVANADLLTGQSSFIHVVKNNEWMRISVSDVEAEIS